ncbi:PAS domain S-box protein [uncultured Lutibacter sp.]|uniref:PAS domain S-box protein n=1 Tax=uncultured Lutibacter sp. TaxID=437739 RepID=UPI0026091DC7|nr:PAS domain S-box protein [uncultured Lutibacter sp.]
MPIQQKYINDTLEFIYKNGYNSSINEFLNQTVKFLSKLLNIEYVLISTYSSIEENTVETRAFYGNQKFLPNITYKLKDTPCDVVIDKDFCCYSSKVQQLFPLDKSLVEMKVESYVGIPLLSSNKKPIGLITFMDIKPIENSQTLETILKIVAIKVEKILEKAIYKELFSENELKHKKLRNILLEGILIHNKGEVFEINETFEKMFGYSSEELIGNDILEKLFPKKYHSFIKSNIVNKMDIPFEMEGIKKNGEVFPIEIESRNVKSKNNHTLKVSVIKDLTKSKKSEIENVKLSKAVEQSANVIVITDIHGNIEYVNPKFTELTGYNLKEAQGKNTSILNSGKHSKDFYKNMWDVILSGKNWKGEIQNKSKNGTLFWEQATITPIKNSKNEIINFLAIKEDITQRKKSEKELKTAYNLLKEKEDYLSNILKTANEGFWIIDINSNTLQVNEKMCTILERDESEIIGKSIYDFVDEENAKIFKCEIKKRAFGLSTSYEIELLKSNGQNVACSFNTSPIYNKNNERIGSFALVTNISNLKLANLKLEATNSELRKLSEQLSEKNRLHIESKNKFKNLFDNSPISLWEEDFSEVKKLIKDAGIEASNLNKYLIKNKDFLIECISKIKILRVNKNTFNLLGAKSIEELRVLLQKTNTKESFKSLANEITAVALNKKEFYGETEFLRMDGKVISAIIKSEIDSEGKSIVSVVDISAIKEAEKQLNIAKLKAEKSDERYRLAVAASGLGIWDMNVKTSKTHFSNYYKKQIGYDKDELENEFSTWVDHLHPDERDVKLQEFKEYLKNPKGQYVTEFRFRHKNGSYIWILSTAEVIKNKKGEVERILGSHRDITIRKKALSKIEEQTIELIKAKEKAEESNRLKTEFLNNMSHEIRTPMNGILGFSQFLSDPSITEDKRNYFINIIQNSGNQLLRVIDDILEISRLETKQVMVIEKPVCLNDLLLELFSIFDLKAKENQIPLYIKNGLSDVESTIFTDKSKLNKILSNLLENALKYTNEGSISFGYQLVGANLEIFVKDTGIGINKDKQEAIFERFSQEEKELSQNAGGLGLGLSIAKENTELLGGIISVDSVKGKGSTFKVSIPYKPINNIIDNNSQKDKSTKENKKHTILIVEDEEVNYLFIEIIITEKINVDCNILHAKDGKEALEMCQQNSEIDFVLMDINMPVMNGFEATKKIREFNTEIPIIMQTAYSTTEDKEKAFDVGCNDFITKPINKNDLKIIMESYLLNKNQEIIG